MPALVSRSVSCGTWSGVELRVHYSAILAVLLAAVSLQSYFSVIYPHWSVATMWATAGSAALTLLLGSTLNGVAQGVTVKVAGTRTARLTLCMFGGLVTAQGGGTSPKTECWMGGVSPLVNALAGAFCLAVASLWPPSPARIPTTTLQIWTVWAGYFNLLLASMNVLPAYPLGGGRMFRAAAWWALGDARRSLRLALRLAQVGAVVGLGAGAIWLAGPRALIGLWTVLTAVVILDTATGMLRNPSGATGPPP